MKEFVMGWDLYYRRAQATGTILARARKTGCYDLYAQPHPEIIPVFGSPEAFLTALRYKWSLLLSGHFERMHVEMDDAHLDCVRAAAHRACRADNPTLWNVLETNSESGNRGASCVQGGARHVRPQESESLLIVKTRVGGCRLQALAMRIGLLCGRA